MPNFSKNDVVLIRYPFSDISSGKIRPAIVACEPHQSADYFIVPITSKIKNLYAGEFVLANWNSAGLNVPSAVKRGIYTVNSALILKLVGHLSSRDSQQLEHALKEWLGL